ncbi:MAG: hypothetical protein GXW85_06640 [Clostridia bacterium]|nr:hypothetical protein [Clostridia bacterium]
MYIYSERTLIQILSFSLGPLIGLIFAAITRNVRSGLILGLFALIIIYLQPVFSDACLKNTARALKLEDVILAEGKVIYFSGNEELQGKLFLTAKYFAFVFNNKIDFFVPIEKIIKIKEELEEVDREIIADLSPLFERKTANTRELSQMLSDLACWEKGLIYLTVGQSFFRNEFVFRVTHPVLWVKKITMLKSRAN